ncbi:MAG: four helix bundle protein [Candidatus Marinimicrobia bacterium]|nr:four helix bundle protein [Candidatus Neomarinimicrobiota bacterium]
MIDRRKNEILDLSFRFALDIIEVYKYLKNSSEYVMSKQLLRSGTSIGANINEAQAALTKKEFISKMSISLKESWETRYWLELLVKWNFYRIIRKNSKYKKILNLLFIC